MPDGFVAIPGKWLSGCQLVANWLPIEIGLSMMSFWLFGHKSRAQGLMLVVQGA